MFHSALIPLLVLSIDNRVVVRVFLFVSVYVYLFSFFVATRFAFLFDLSVVVLLLCSVGLSRCVPCAFASGFALRVSFQFLFRFL